MGVRLYELADAWTRIRDVFDGLTDPDEIESFGATLDAIEVEIHEKAENIGVLIKELKAEEAALQTEERAIRARRATVESKTDRLTSYLLEQMRAVGIEKVAGPRASVTLATNPPKVVIHDLEWFKQDTGGDYWRRYKWDETNLDKENIRKAVEAGEIPAQAAGLERGQSLRIK